MDQLLKSGDWVFGFLRKTLELKIFVFGGAMMFEIDRPSVRE